MSVPRSRQSASKTLAQKAFAYGFEGVQVDGNDVFAVYRVTKEALDKAKAGGGPTFIECLTYRMGDHTTADDASRYRFRDEVKAWKAKDPIIRLRLFMEKKGLWNEYYLRAPIKRITGYDVVIPFPKLEDDYMPSIDRIRHGIEELDFFISTIHRFFLFDISDFFELS